MTDLSVMKKLSSTISYDDNGDIQSETFYSLVSGRVNRIESYESESKVSDSYYFYGDTFVRALDAQNFALKKVVTYDSQKGAEPSSHADTDFRSSYTEYEGIAWQENPVITANYADEDNPNQITSELFYHAQSGLMDWSKNFKEGTWTGTSIYWYEGHTRAVVADSDFIVTQIDNYDTGFMADSELPPAPAVSRVFYSAGDDGEPFLDYALNFTEGRLASKTFYSEGSSKADYSENYDDRQETSSYTVYFYDDVDDASADLKRAGAIGIDEDDTLIETVTYNVASEMEVTDASPSGPDSVTGNRLAKAIYTGANGDEVIDESINYRIDGITVRSHSYYLRLQVLRFLQQKEDPREDLSHRHHPRVS